MTADQLEYSAVLAFGALATVVGYSRFDLGLSEKRRATLRWSGPGILVIFTGLLVATFVR